ncbi:enoyl-CoA delta isomerase 1, mitochondrial-like [Saccoglossus kowalevskii]|uniref:Enoyl-CoA delta isomerase 1, mitochondrial-like n=1 Tax=Saccoglossus kowalevskii TaxID=10224 RepID=A0ABM0H194_SACKO|nr:PREDICTED: enoyl-CoA delta isomerase 1, mitochondrial-like [Saccoglossus kowalevskii]
MAAFLSRAVRELTKNQNRIVSTQARLSAIRHSSSTRSLLEIERRSGDDSGIAIVRMNRPPVNSLSLEFLTEFNISLEKLENDSSCRGLILTSTLPVVFSSGVDINEMYPAKKDRLCEFWKLFFDLCHRLYGSRLVTIAAINGHAIAGGCALTQLCDYRIMTSSQETKLKLNATELGLPPPAPIVQIIMNNVGQRKCEKIWQTAQLFNPQSALKVGLVDELRKDNVMLGALQEIKTWLKIPDAARILTKQAIRQATQNLMNPAVIEDEINRTVAFILEENTQDKMKSYFESMKRKQTDV